MKDIKSGTDFITLWSALSQQDFITIGGVFVLEVEAEMLEEVGIVFLMQFRNSILKERITIFIDRVGII